MDKKLEKTVFGARVSFNPICPEDTIMRVLSLSIIQTLVRKVVFDATRSTKSVNGSLAELLIGQKKEFC
jgi:hypothetical protein